MTATIGFEHDLTAPAFFADPYPIYSRLREEAPVYWSESWGGWLLTRAADVAAALGDPQRFSSAGRVGYLLRGLPEGERDGLARLEAHYSVGLAPSAPPAHTRQRALLTRAFTPRVVERLRPRVEALVGAMLDAAAARGRLDLIADLAFPLPATMIAELLGAPYDDLAQFRAWAEAINGLFGAAGRTSAGRARAAQAAVEQMHDYIGALAAERRVRPTDDLLGRLVAAEAEGERLAPAELVAIAVTLFVAGHETTTHLIGNGALALLRHPDQLALLLGRPELMPAAVEELLRYDTPVQRGWRMAAADLTIAGVSIPAGALVLPMLGAANRDPALYADPDRLDVARPPARHFGFGHGIHFCLGAPLARLEVPIALGALLRRFRGLRLAPNAELRWRHDVALRGLEALPLVWGEAAR
ncbi:MAG TPA: cytochrome P450 [Chloroflexaceae bacterium]|nr:cytochrome P450 [Chloroflexaceae bacterium]